MRGFGFVALGGLPCLVCACGIIAGIDNDYSVGGVEGGLSDAFAGADSATRDGSGRRADAKDGRMDAASADVTRPSEGGGRQDQTAPPGDAAKSDGCTTACGCPTGETMCGGACVDLTTDNANCGMCGQACAATAPSTSTCAAARCITVLVNDGLGFYGAGIAVNVAKVFWSDGAQIRSIPVGGGSPTVLATPDQPFQVQLDAANVYWTSFGGEVASTPLAGGAITTLVSSATSGNTYPPYFLAVDATSVYWTTQTNNDTGTIVKTPSGGGTLTTLATGQELSAGIVVDATNVYWGNMSTTANAGAVMAVPIIGGSPSTLVPAQVGPLAFATSNGNVYWTDPAIPGPIASVATSGGAPTTLAVGHLPTGIAVDGINVYWADTDGDAIMKVPVGGGAPVTLATTSGPQYVAVDATSVYWTTSNGPMLKVTPK
jgi:hypothetical protein